MALLCSVVFLYNLSIHLYWLGIRLVAVWNKKAELWLRGRGKTNDSRRRIADFTLQTKIAKLDTPILWFHCASLGEFEQGSPLMEALKKQNNGAKIVLTFFSPSGYEVRKDWPGADLVCYLPLDTKRNARQFVEAIKPTAAFFVKYEFWYHHLNELNTRKIPTYLVAGRFRPGQVFFKWYGGLYRKMLGFFTHFFLQDEKSAKLLEGINITNKMVCGDPRYDRCLDNIKVGKSSTMLDEFCGKDFTIVAGSTWEPEEELLQLTYKTTDHKIIIAPHDISRAKDIQKQFEGSVLYSEWVVRHSNLNVPEDAAIPYCLIVDNIGMLASLYQYASVALVGGGFSGKLHNVLEAIAWGKAVFFGPNHSKFPEAKVMLKEGCGFEVASKDDWQQLLEELYEMPEKLRAAGDVASNFMQKNAGATSKILIALVKP